MCEKNYNKDDLNKIFEAEADKIFAGAQAIFTAKLRDYGAAWLLSRDISMADQLWIKIKRIRTLQELEESGMGPAVAENADDEFIGIINYALMMLMRQRMPRKYPLSECALKNTALVGAVTPEGAAEDYAAIRDEIKELRNKKNHDYGAAWAEMHPYSLTDQILMKIYRVKTILLHGGRTEISENTDAQLMDIVNYCLFALVRLRKLI